MKIEDGTRATILIHFYRAMVGRADSWRMRMDTTTNWAIGATAAIMSFALGDPRSPHYTIHIGAFLTVIFLLLEARRLTFYHLWQQRALILERELVIPAASPSPTATSSEISLARLGTELVPKLGETAPMMSLGKAAARRLRRVYIYLFAAQVLAWLVKLSIHPNPAVHASDVVSRAAIGWIPGVAVLGLTIAACSYAAILAMWRGASRRGPRLE